MTDRADFVEGFALRLAESGMQRMAARAFALLLTAPEGGLTAREIGEQLHVSAGAVSGATSYLTRTALIERRRVPGERSDRFDVQGTTWAEAIATETATVSALRDWLARGMTAVDDPAAQRRLGETHDFFAFLVRELPRLIDRWHAERGARA